jgi:predicted membrane channel-forming protein YqfA (hemolysin III family)
MIGAAALHVGVGSVFDMAAGGGLAVGAIVSAVSMRPAILEGSFAGTAASSLVTTAAAVAVAVVVSVASVLSAVVTSILVVGAVFHLGFEGGTSGSKCRHLFHHLLALLGRICHVVDLLLHLLLGDGVCSNGSGVVALGD